MSLNGLFLALPILMILIALTCFIVALISTIAPATTARTGHNLRLFRWLRRRIKNLWRALNSSPAEKLSRTAEILDQVALKEYHWTFPVQAELQRRLPTHHFSIKLPVDRQRYETYRRQKRDTNALRFHHYLLPLPAEVEFLAQKLLELGQTRGYPPYEQLCFTLAFVQQGIDYVHDLSPTGRLIEYPKYPIETLLEQTGDCEDQAILAAALLQLMDYQVALVILPTHVALGVTGLALQGTTLLDADTGIIYFYVETTVPGWLPGEAPQEFKADILKQAYNILPLTGAIAQ